MGLCDDDDNFDFTPLSKKRSFITYPYMLAVRNQSLQHIQPLLASTKTPVVQTQA